MRLAALTDYYIHERRGGVVDLKKYLGTEEVMRLAGITSTATFERRLAILRKHRKFSQFDVPLGATQFTSDQAWKVINFQKWVNQASVVKSRKGAVKAAITRLMSGESLDE